MQIGGALAQCPKPFLRRRPQTLDRIELRLDRGPNGKRRRRDG